MSGHIGTVVPGGTKGVHRVLSVSSGIASLFLQGDVTPLLFYSRRGSSFRLYTVPRFTYTVSMFQPVLIVS